MFRRVRKMGYEAWGSHRRSGVITKEEGTSLERDMLVRPHRHRGCVWESVEGKVQTLGTSNDKSLLRRRK